MLETAPRPTIRTIVASFVFMDLVGFSKGTAADQYAAKARLSSVLQHSLAALREIDYWIKDTGDGALIAFVSNPEHALYMALALAHEYPSGDESAPSSSLRTGLHLGTVKVSVDVEARSNFIGDGINAAKRIMDFAHPGQIAASRSFFEAIANLDAAYAALFQHLGAPDDKHGRAHELYALAPSEAVLEKLRADLAADRSDAPSDSTVSSVPEAAKPVKVVSAPAPRGRRRAAVIVGAVALGIAALLVAMRAHEPSPSAVVAPQPPPASVDSAGPAAMPKRNSAQEETGAAEVPKTVAPSLPDASATTKSTPEPSAPVAPPVAEPARPAAAGTPAKTKAVPKAAVPASGTPEMRSASGPSSPRCSHILQKAALGEPLTPDEQKELANTCR